MSPLFGHGRLRLYLLRLLEESPRHGYEVIRLLQDRFLGIYAPSPGTIYPRLARLEEEGLVTHDEENGRKVYRITEAGREELRNRGYERDAREQAREQGRAARDSAREAAAAAKEQGRAARDSAREAAEAAKEQA